MKLNKFTTKAAADKAQVYDFECKQASDALTMAPDAYAAYYAVTKRWAEPAQTIAGAWVYAVCPQSDKTYDTIEHSVDLFPVVAEI